MHVIGDGIGDGICDVICDGILGDTDFIYDDNF